MTIVGAHTLKKHDTIIVPTLNDKVTVFILSDQEPCEDLFGRDMFRYWAERIDTDTQGWMMFGWDGIVDRVDETG